MGIVHTTRALLPVFERCNGGVIINNASLAGLGAVPMMAAYTASKFGVVGLTKALACELGGRNVRVNAVCPGMVWTDMGRFETELLGDPMKSESERKRQLAEGVPLGQRWADPDEIAEVVAFLASPAARYISGAAIPVAAALAAGL
jgi:3-oxoacyl-[acyl-carrier protein] reductase